MSGTPRRGEARELKEGGDHRHVGPGGSYVLSVLSREVLGLKFRWRAASTPQVNIAMERGEIYVDRWLGQHQGAVALGTATRSSSFSVTSVSRTGGAGPFAASPTSPRTDADRQALRLVLARQATAARIPAAACRWPVDGTAPRLRRDHGRSCVHRGGYAARKSKSTDDGEEVQALVAQVHRTTPADVVERVRTMMASQ